MVGARDAIARSGVNGHGGSCATRFRPHKVIDARVCCTVDARRRQHWESGENPELPRSGKQERKLSFEALKAMGAFGKRQPVGVFLSKTLACKSEDRLEMLCPTRSEGSANGTS